MIFIFAKKKKEKKKAFYLENMSKQEGFDS